MWLKGHTDFGTITLLYSQPVSALQILLPGPAGAGAGAGGGTWRWVRHVPGALVVNAGDALEFLTGAFYRATVHRVVRPPADQRGRARLGAFYFAMCDDAVRLVPPAPGESAVLDRAGAVRRFEDADAPTMEEWRRARTSAYGQTQLTRKEGGVEEEVIGGVVVKHYN